MSEPSLLEYARFYGIAKDHRAQDLSKLLQEALTNEPIAVSELPDFPIPKKEDILQEKFELTRSAAKLLHSYISPPPPPKLDDYLPNPRRWRELKLEIPLLETSHAQDMKDFRDMIRSGSLEALTKEIHQTILPETSQEDSDRWCDRHLPTTAELIAAEKLSIPRQAMLQLQDAVTDRFTPDMHRNVYEDLLPSIQVSQVLQLDISI